MRDDRDELVRIDARGEAHPIGTVASQRMRARKGVYRMLPAPPHVVFMRYTGEDGRRDAQDGAIVRLAGEITAPGSMCDLLALLGQAGWRGELVVLDGEGSRSIFFDSGNVVGAITSRETERLGAVLYKYGMLTEEQCQRILATRVDTQRFGECAVELGLLSQEQVYTFITKQVEEVVFAALTVSDGTFFFLDGFDETRLASRHAANANALLMEGVTRMDEMRYFRQRIPSAGCVPSRALERPPPDEYAGLWQCIDGKRNVEELGRATGLGEFETTRQVYALAQYKYLSIQPPRFSGGTEALVTLANGALQAILTDVDAAGNGVEVRESLASFAAGAGVYEILFRGAGPDASGALNPRRVSDNVLLVASGADPENVLREMLYEYLSFALFSAGAVLGPQERDLKKRVGPVLDQLCPSN
jgi:hypothetical protein